MSRNRLALTLYAAMAVCGGLIGGAASDQLRRLTGLTASAAATSSNTVTASEFDLVDKEGKTRGKMFMDGGVVPTLELYDFQGKERISLKTAFANAELVLNSGNNQISLETDQYGTFLWFNDKGPSAEPRFTVQIWSDRTSLSLSGPDHKTSVGTYIHEKGAATSFTDRNDKQRAVLGIAQSSGEPYLTFSDENERIRSELRSNLSLLDEKGNVRTVVGSTVLKNTKTGSTEHLSPSSLILFGENGRVLWQAP
jgi:hypothetical protein